MPDVSAASNSRPNFHRIGGKLKVKTLPDIPQGLFDTNDCDQRAEVMDGMLETLWKWATFTRSLNLMKLT